VEHNDAFEVISHQPSDQRGSCLLSPATSQPSGRLWSITEEDITLGMRARGLPVEAPDDLTPEERRVLA
jgi:hypothetical protein